MSDQPDLVRSYQRIFRPDRRVYAIDGRTLPIPGGVSLRWLGIALGALVAVIVLAGGSHLVSVLLGLGVGWAVDRLGHRPLVLAGFAAGVGTAVVARWVLGTLDWPLRLIVVPALVATVATQVTPDGRPAHRFAWSWLRVRFGVARSLGRPTSGRPGPACVSVGHDEHGPNLHAGCVTGPAVIEFASPVSVSSGRRRRVVTPLGCKRPQGLMLDRLDVGDGERVVIRP